METDRNLYFGLIAFRAERSTKELLAEACMVWMQQPAISATLPNPSKYEKITSSSAVARADFGKLFQELAPAWT